MLQTLQEGAAVREYMHQRKGQVPSAAGVRMLAWWLIRLAVLLVCAAGIACSTPALAQAPEYQLDASNSRVVRLANLSNADCHRAALSGRIAKRDFDAQGVILKGIVVEIPSGDRTFINIDNAAIDSPQVSMAARGWIFSGLRTLLKEGQEVRLGVKLCGAAGRVAFLDAVAPATATPVSRVAHIGPSFDCESRAATTQPLAQMICMSAELSYWELSYVIAYQAVKESSSPQDQKRLVDDANALVVALNDDCGLPSNGPIQRSPTAKEIACIGAHFQQQRNALITQSSGWAHEEATLEPRQTIEIQRGLQAKGYLSASDTVDGVFGPVTRRAIRAWQQDNGVSATGFGSRALLAALNGAPGATSVSQQAPQGSSVPTLPATTRDRSGKTSSIQLVLGESTELRPQEVFAKAANAVYVVETTEAIGSAVAISDHELLTNCHVVKDAPMVALVRQGDKQAARVTSANPDADRCILTVLGTLPTWVKVRPYADVKVGEHAYTIGTPKGLELTLAEGIVSSKRSADGTRYIQTSAPISPGSSGGGLFDAQGNLIGITTFMLKDSQNLNFAIAAEEYAK